MATGDANHKIHAGLFAVALLLASTSQANLQDTEPETRNSPLIATPEAVKLEPFSGSAAYSYRFEIPPGTGGLAPDLVLSYSTLTRGTEYGFGWSLNLSRIERSTRFGPPTYDAQDQFELDGDLLVRDPDAPSTRFHKMRSDFSRILYFAATGAQPDFWEVTRPDGLRMRYGSRPSSNARLTNGIGLSGPTFRWLLDEVVDPRGNSYRLEYECASATGSDCSGSVVYVYPKRVRYSFRNSTEVPSAAAPRTQRLVTFDWGIRKNADDGDIDRPTTLRSGFMIQIDRRLLGVRVGLDADASGEIEGAEQVRRYELAYSPKFKYTTDGSRLSSPPFSQLSSIQRYGSGGGSSPDTPFPSAANPRATRFSYPTPQRGFPDYSYDMAKPPQNPPKGGRIRLLFNQGDEAQTLRDMNGDGILDRVRATTTGSWTVNYGLSRSQGGPGYGESVLWKWCADIWHCSSTTADSSALVNVANGADWIVIKSDIIDMDGDALPDRISVDDNYEWTFRKNTGNGGFGLAVPWHGPELGSAAPGKARYLNASAKTGEPGNLRLRGKSRLVDVNGDGLPDHLAVNASEPDRFWFSRNLGCTQSGCGFAPPVSIPGRLPTVEALSFGDRGDSRATVEDIVDLNGDGLPDLASIRDIDSTRCTEVGFGNGTTFPVFIGSPSVGYASGNRACGGAGVDNLLAEMHDNLIGDVVVRTIIDINGDGIPDSIAQAGNIWTGGLMSVKLGLGDGSFTSGPYFDQPRWIRNGPWGSEDTLDVDGDGLVDHVMSTNSCEDCFNYTWQVYANPATETGPEWLLTRVESEAGSSTALSYQPSVDVVGVTAPTPESLAATAISAPHHSWVIKSIATTDGRAGTAQQEQTVGYAEPRFDYALRENRGFRMVESTDAALVTKRSLFHQSLAKRGLVEFEEEIFGGAVLRSHSTTWTEQQPVNESGTPVPGATFAAPALETTSLFAGGNRQDHQVQRRFDPTFGSVDLETDSGSDGVVGTSDDLRSHATFEPVDTADWLIRLPHRTWKEFDGAPAPLNDESFTYDRGLVETRAVSRFSPTTGTTESLVETWQHDDFGNTTGYWPASRPTSEIPQVMTTWESQFNTFPEQITRQDPAGTSIATKYAFDARLGEVTKRLDPLGHLECWGFDTYGRLSSRADKSAATVDIAQPCNVTRALFVFADGQLGAADSQYLSLLTYPWAGAAPIETRQYFDGLGRVFREAKQARTSIANDYLVTTRAWGTRGELVEESEPVRTCPDPAACGPAVSPSPVHATAFDALLRPTLRSLRLTNGTSRAQESMAYSIANHDGSPGNELVETHTIFGSPTADLIRTIGKDPRGEVVSVYEVGGGTTFLRRDPSGRITLVDGPDVLTADSTTDANLLALEYNSEGQRVAVGRPSALSALGGGPRTSYSYDVDGNLREILPARGPSFAITHTYDGLGRLRFKDLAPTNSISSPGPNDVVYQYDVSSYGSYPGKLGRVASGTAETEFRYDARGRADKKRRVIGSSIYETQYAFDLLDRVTAIAFPNQSYIATLFDGGQAKGFVDLGTIALFNSFKASNTTTRLPFIDGIDFHASGALESISFLNGGVVMSREFDPDDYRLTRTTTTGPGGTLDQLNYTYDTAGNVQLLYDSAGRLSELFLYDSLHRLEGALASGTYAYTPGLTYSYDTAGNLRQKEGLTLGYGALGAGPHAVTSASGSGGFLAAYSYDLDGNVSGRAFAGTDEFEFFSHDAENRMTAYNYFRSTGGIGSATYAYDDTGGRVSRSASKTGLASESEHYVDRDYEVDFNRQVTRSHLYIGQARIATLERALSGTANPPVVRELHYHSNHLGTPRLVTDQTGAVIQRTFTKPFGEIYKVVDGQGNDLLPSNRATDYLFTGQHADVESALQYFGARYYDPLIGRFLEQDPELMSAPEGTTFGRIETSPQRWNWYAYASNSPTNRVDLFGASDELAFWFYGAGAPGEFSGYPAYTWSSLADPSTVQVLGNAYNSVLDSIYGAPENGDGVLSLAEAGYHYRHGGGAPISVDLSRVNLSNLTESDFPGIGYKVSGLRPAVGEDLLVYEHFDMRLVTPTSVYATHDEYDFRYWPLRYNWGSISGISDDAYAAGRNIGTFAGHVVAGYGDPFFIKFYGYGQLGPRRP